MVPKILERIMDLDTDAHALDRDAILYASEREDKSMIRALHAAGSIATFAIDLIGVRRAAVAAARAAESAAGTLISVGRVLDESTVQPSPGRLSPAEIELISAAVAIPDDGQIRSAQNPVPAAEGAFRATIRLIEAAAALRAERSAARRGIAR